MYARDRDLPPRGPELRGRLSAAWGPCLVEQAPVPRVRGLAELAAAATARQGATTPPRTSGRGSDEGSIAATARQRANTPPRSCWSGDDSSIIWEPLASSGRLHRSVSARSGCSSSSRTTLATSRCALKEINAQARFEALHLDSACRRMRREEAENEKSQREEEEVKQLLPPPPKRAWELRWANQQSAAYARRQQALEEKRELAAASRDEQELKECSFAPRLVTKEAHRRRHVQEARRRLECLAERQIEWAGRLEALRCEEARLAHSEVDDFRHVEECDNEAFLDAQQRAVAVRRCRTGVLQVLHELGALELEALSLAARTTRQTQGRRNPEAATTLRELCPAFDLSLLPQLQEQVSCFDVLPDADFAWEVPGALFRPPLPVPMAAERSAFRGSAPDEARPWTWSRSCTD